MKTSKSKTFQQGDSFFDTYEWLMRQFDCDEYTPEGTNWSLDGEPAPHDPVSKLKHKYVVTITKIENPQTK